MRYFFIPFAIQIPGNMITESRDPQVGNGSIWFEFDGHPSHKELLATVHHQNYENFPGLEVKHIFVSSIHEFKNKDDYDAFVDVGNHEPG